MKSFSSKLLQLYVLLLSVGIAVSRYGGSYYRSYNSSGDGSGGDIAGIIIGVIAGVTLIIFIIIVILCKTGKCKAQQRYPSVHVAKIEPAPIVTSVSSNQYSYAGGPPTQYNPPPSYPPPTYPPPASDPAYPPPPPNSYY